MKRGNSKPGWPVGSEEWIKINKPPRGWLHPDQMIMGEGMRYNVRYIGSIKVNASMKSLDFDTRSLVAKECINRVREAACSKNNDRRRKTDKRLNWMLGETPNMEDAGSYIHLVVTISRLNLIVIDTGKIIASHDMPNISFTSGGDAETLDFIAYVAKDHRSGRLCYVVECGADLAQDVITTIGQAFELRYEQYLRRTQPQQSHQTVKSDGAVSSNGAAMIPSDDPEYYNDLPGKIPPECMPPLPPLPDYSTAIGMDSNGCKKKIAAGLTPALVLGNLIDLGTEISNETPTPMKPEPEYVNSMISTNTTDTLVKDPFDMQPFEQSLSTPSVIPPPPPHQRIRTVSPILSGSTSTSITKTKVSNGSEISGAKQVPDLEEWFHGPISRKDSEGLVVKDGDFLVRESQGSSRQYVLTGMQGGVRKHFLLVDPEGVVRTKDRTFESVSHLVNYHCDNGRPIIVAESALVLRKPVPRDRLI